MDGAFSHDSSVFAALRPLDWERERRSRHERLRGLVARQELLLRGDRARHAWGEELEAARCVWLGVGLAGRALSCGVPIDVAAMLLAQEMVRRELGLARSEILLADENALAAGWSPVEVRRCAHRTHDALERLIDALGVRAVVLPASSLARPEARAELAARLDPQRPYVGLQLAQVEAMRRRGGGIKLGWQLGRSGFDEVALDRDYRRVVGGAVSTVYTGPGRRLDRGRPRACPYLGCDARTRILLDGEVPVATLLHRADPRAAAGYRRLLGKIARAAAHVDGRRASADPLEEIEQLRVRVRRGGR